MRVRSTASLSSTARCCLPWLAALGVLLPAGPAQGNGREPHDEREMGRSEGLLPRRAVTGGRELSGFRSSLPMQLAALDQDSSLPATGSQFAVLVPDIGEPYRSVFRQIVEGIEERARGRALVLPVGDATNTLELARELQRRDIRTVLALGRQGLKTAVGLDKDFSVLTGAVLSAPESDSRPLSVHSLTPDPALLFARLRQLAPETRRVFVVVDPRHNAWLMRLAREAARLQGLELQVSEASDLKAAVRGYQDILAQMNPRSDALWLAQDATTVDDTTVLPFLLQESWNRSLLLFSSSLSHARRGALFSLAPDNTELGRNLAAAALGSPPRTPGSIQPLRQVLLAVNVRTANHLGLGPQLRGLRIDLSFPSP